MNSTNMSLLGGITYDKDAYRAVGTFDPGLNGSSTIKSNMDSTINFDGVAKGSKKPMKFGYGGMVKLGPWAPFYEGKYSAYKYEVSGEQAVDVYPTFDHVLGSKVTVSQNITGYGAFGHQPSPYGNGLMKERSEENIEQNGVNIARTVDAVDRKVVSGGVLYREKFWNFTGGMSYEWGDRSVPESSRGYGDYSLRIMQFVASSKWNL